MIMETVERIASMCRESEETVIAGRLLYHLEDEENFMVLTREEKLDVVSDLAEMNIDESDQNHVKSFNILIMATSNVLSKDGYSDSFKDCVYDKAIKLYLGEE